MSIFDRTGQHPTLTEGYRALDLFTDRGELLRLFCRRLHADPPEERILFFYGAGGNGKSLLLRYLRERACKQLRPEDWEWVRAIPDDEDFQRHVEQAADAEPVPWAWLDFGAPSQGESRPREPFYALLMLHRQLVSHGLRFPLYDFAVLWYLHKTEGLTPERLQRLFPAETLDLVDALTQVITGVGWVGVGKAVLGLFDRHLGERFTLYQHRRRLRPEDVQAIQRLEPEPELRDALPDLFAHDLNTAMGLPGAPQRLALFFDTHEALWGEERHLADYAFFARDEWLRRLLGHLELEKSIVPVLAGRDRPRWLEATEWAIPAAFLELRLVGHLSEADAVRYLERAGVADADLRAHLATYTEGHPYYLGLCADVVLAAAGRGVTLTPADFQAELETARKDEVLVERLLKYVDNEVEHAVRALSAARAFDWDVYAHLGQALHFQVTEPAFHVLTNFSFVRPAEGGEPQRYRMHGLLRELLRDDPTARRADEVLEAFYRARGDEAGVAEAIYHAGRLDPERGAKEWCDTFDDALERARYSLCQVLQEVRAEMEVPGSFWLGQVSQEEGEYLATLSRHREAEAAYRQAIAAYEEALRRAPDDVAAHNNKGNALLRLGELQAGLGQHDAALASYRQAIAAYAEALRRAPDFVMAHNNKGLTLRSLGALQEKMGQPAAAQASYRQAVAAYTRVTELRPTDPAAWDRLGEALYDLEEDEAAVEAYSQAVALAPDAAYLRRNRAGSLVLLGRLEEAEADVNWALAHDPESPYTHGRLGQLRLAQGRFAEAEAAFRQAAAQDEAWLSDVALALLGQGRGEEALATLDRWLAQASRKQRRETLRWLEVVLRHAPQAPGAGECRRRLEATNEFAPSTRSGQRA